MDAWLRERSFRRQARHTVRDALMGKTPAAASVFAGQSRPFLERYTADGDHLPAIAVFAATQRRSNKGDVEDATLSLAVECWVRVPGGVIDSVESSYTLEDSLDDIVDAAVQALRESDDFVRLCGPRPDFVIQYGIEQEAHAGKFAAAGILVEAARKRRIELRQHEGPLAEATPLRTVAIDLDFRGPHGTTTDDDGGPDGTIETSVVIELED